MTQLALEQQVNLDRVRSRIARSIVAFCNRRQTFHMEELLAYVEAETQVAPDSPGRILRDLRQQRLINYRVVNRRASLYEVLPVNEQTAVGAAAK